jgi:uncharacterized protein YgiM (DUF1202 family)
MARNRLLPQFLAGWSRAFALGLATAVIVVLALAAGRATAAPRLQSGTVPPPTPKATATTVPRATATPHRNTGDNDTSNNTNRPAASATPASGAVASQAQQGGGDFTAVVLSERLNVRSGPGTSYGVIGVVRAGETLAVLGRNNASTWWYICCVSGTTTTGWVSAPFVQVNFAVDQAATLIPLAGPGAAGTVTAPIATTTRVTTTGGVTATTALTTAALSTATAGAGPGQQLQLRIEQAPPFAWQGQELSLIFTVTNTTDAIARDVELRNEVPAQLRFIAAEAPTGATVAEEEPAAGRLVFIVTWPTLAPGASSKVTVRLQIAVGLPDGTVIDDLAVVSATGIEPYTSGVSIGMPPTTLPDFQ